MLHVDIVIVGSGRLARSLILTLAACIRDAVSVLVVGRNVRALRDVSLLARARAVVLGRPLAIVAEECDYSHRRLRQLFSRVRAAAIVTLASRQSPWDMGPRWRALVDCAGYGLTLPLQACLADRIFRAARDALPGAVFINGCYPDLANGLLATRGVHVACGIGNGAIIEAVLQSRFPDDDVRLVAHHAHVAALIKGRWDGLPPPLVWQNGCRWSDDARADLTRHISLPNDSSLNEVTVAAAVPLLLALTGRGPQWTGYAPGVGGFPGGHPVRVSKGRVEDDLPSGTSPGELRALSDACGAYDGVVIGDNGVYELARSPDRIHAACGVQMPEGLLRWTADDLELHATALESFRESID